MRLQFGDLTFEGGQRLLLRGSEPVHLSPKAFQLLELLLSRRPDAVSKKEIQEKLWPKTFVVEGNLPPLVSEIRSGLGESGRGASCIRTVFAYGYAFRGAVRELASAPAPRSHRHVLVWGRREIDLPEGVSLLGREREAAIWIGHSSVSREHARIEVDGGRATIQDLGSKNGTWRGDKRIDGRVSLEDGDELRVGTAALVYHSSPVGSSTRTKSVS